MKTIKLFVLIIAIAGLVACSSSSGKGDESSFTAKVIEKTDNSMIVESVEEDNNGESGEQFSFGTDRIKNADEIEEGDKVLVYYSGDIKETAPAQITVFRCDILDKAEEEEPEKRMVMFQDKLYVDTGETSNEPRCGVMDFTLDSSVEKGEPQENNQTNFGIGYGGQYGMKENTIEVNINNEWCIFALSEEK